MKILAVKILLIISIVLSLDRMVSAYLKDGIDSYYDLNKNADIVFIGHSRTETGIDTKIVQSILNIPVAKYAVSGTDIYAHFAMLKQYCNRNLHRKPVSIVFNIDKNYLVGESPSKNISTLFYPYMDDVGIKEYVYDNKSSFSSYAEKKVFHLLRFVEVRNNSLRGLLGETKNYEWRMEAANSPVKNKIKKQENTSSQTKINLLNSMIDYAQRLDIKVIFVDIPDAEVVLGEETYSAIVRDIAAKKGVCYINISKEFTKRYELFFDKNHLNVKGRTIFSTRIARELERVLPSSHIVYTAEKPEPQRR